LTRRARPQLDGNHTSAYGPIETKPGDYSHGQFNPNP